MTNAFTIVSQIHFLYDRLLTAALRNHPQLEVNAAQMRLLMSLWEKDGIHMQKLADRNCLKKTTLSTMLPKMVEAELIQINADESDHRASLITLTEKAKSLKDTHHQINMTLEEQLFKDICEDEKETFLYVLDRLKTNMQIIEENNTNGKNNTSTNQ